MELTTPSPVLPPNPAPTPVRAVEVRVMTGKASGVPALVLAAAAGFAAGAGWASRQRGGAAPPGGLAHRANGSDDSGSLAAEIADEGLIPDDISMLDTMPGGLVTAS